MGRIRTPAELQANQVLERARVEFEFMGIPWSNYEVDVELIASLVFQLGVQRVSLQIGERRYAGVLDAEGGNIGIEENDHPHRQRFSIAHEIGHLTIHVNRTSSVGLYYCTTQDMDMASTVGQVSLDTQSLHKRQEWEANVFAASLLIPEKAVLPMFRSVGGSVRKLAKHFNVSGQAMEIRLQHLDLPYSYRA